MPAKEPITTKFKVDISDLKRGITEANNTIKKANAEFNAATAGMDDWANSADGVKAKLKQLDSVLNEQKKKLENYKEQFERLQQAEKENAKRADELRTKYQQAAQQFGKNSKEAQQYKTALNAVEKEQIANAKAADKAEITMLNQVATVGKVEKQIRQYDSTLKQLDQSADQADKSLNDLSKSIKETSDGFTTMRGTIATALGSLVADKISGFIGEVKSSLLDTEESLDKFQAATGTSAAAMGEFKDQILDLYKNNYGESIDDVAESMARVKQVTNETDPSKLQEMTKYAIDLRDAFGSDFDESIRGINNLMYQYGISAEEAFDLFAKGSQVGLDYTDELGDNVAEYSGNFKQAGYSAEEYFQLLENGTSNGAYNLDKVNDAINEATNKLADGSVEKNLKIYSKGTQDLFKKWQKGGATQKDVIDSIVDDINNCKNEQEALTMAATLFGTMGEDSNLDFIKSLTSVGDTFSDVKGTMEDVDQVRWDNTKSQLVSIGRSLMIDVVQPLLNTVVPALNAFGGWFKDHIPEIIALVAGISTAIVGLKIASIMRKVKEAVEGSSGAFALLNDVVGKNKFVIIASIIASLIAYFITLWNTSETFRNFWIGLWEGMKNIVSTAVTAIQTAFKTVVNFFTTTIPTVFNNIVNFFKGNWQNILLLILNPFVGVIALLYQNSDKFREIVDKIVSFFKELPTKIYNAIVGAITKVADWGKKLRTKAVEVGSTFVKNMVNTVKNLPKKIYNAIVGAISRVASWGSKLKSKGSSAAKSLLKTVVNGVKSIPGKIGSAISGALSVVVSWGSKLASKGMTAAKKLGTGIINALRNLPSQMVSIGSNIVSGIVNGITGAAGRLFESLKSLAKNALDKAKSALGIHSPSIAFRNQVGRQIVAGIVVGMRDSEGTLLSTMKSIMGSVLNSAKLVTNGQFSTAGAKAAEQFSTAIQSKLSTLSDKMSYTVETKLARYDTEITKSENELARREKYEEKLKSLKASNKYKKASKKQRKKMLNDLKKQYKDVAGHSKKYYQDIVTDWKNRQEAYKTATDKALSEFNEVMSKFGSQAEQLVSDTINGITETYQSKWDNLVSLQDTMVQKLQGFGDLFTVSGAGVMTVNDIKSQTDQIKAYMERLNSIKGLVSDELFAQIATYDVDQGKAFIDQLLAMSQDELKAYNDAYTEKLNLSEKLTEELYKSDFDKISSGYKDAITQAFAGLPAQLEIIAKQCMQGFASGLTEDTNYLSRAVQDVANEIIKQFKNELQINSPSKVFATLGGFSAEGYGEGFIQQMKDLKSNLVASVPMQSIARAGGVVNHNQNSQTVNQTFNQYNSSPKALSRLEIYRQTKNALAFSKGV